MKLSPFLAVAATFVAALSPAQNHRLIVSNYFADSATYYLLPKAGYLGTLSDPNLQGTLGVTLHDGKLYVCSESGNKVLRFNVYSGLFIDVFITAGLDHPTSICFDPAGNAYVANFNNSSVTKYDGQTGALLGTFVAPRSNGLSGPDIGTTFGPDGNLYVPSFYNHRILRFNGQTGAYIDDFVTAGLGGLRQPRIMVWRPDGNVYVTSDSGNKVLRYNASTGAYVDTFIGPGSGGLSGAAGMVFGPDGYLYVASWHNNKVIRYNSSTGVYVDTPVDSGVDATVGPVSLTDIAEPPLRTLTASSPQVVGGSPFNAVIGLGGKAILGGSAVSLTSSPAGLVTAPATVNVVGGDTTATAFCQTSRVRTSTSATLTAQVGGVSKSVTVTLTPGLSVIQANPSTVVGGQDVTATVYLLGPAPANGTTVKLTCSTLLTVPSVVVVPPGAISCKLTVKTSPVKANTMRYVVASLAGTARSVGITLTP